MPLDATIGKQITEGHDSDASRQHSAWLNPHPASCCRVVIVFGSTNQYGTYRAFFQKKEVGSKAPAQVDQPWPGAERALDLRSESEGNFASPQNFSARSVTPVR